MRRDFSWIPPERLSTTDETFRVRNRCSPKLAASIRKSGICTPLLVQPLADGYRLVSGWGRWLARREEEPLPCWLLPRKASLEELWTIFLQDNDTWNTVEVARALGRLGEMPTLGEEEIVRQMLPLLGLSRSRELYRHYLQLLHLPEPVLEFIAERDLPLRRASMFGTVSSQGAERLVRVARDMKLSLNECSQTLEALREIARRDSVADHQILEDLLSEDGTVDGQRFRHRLWSRRYPQLQELHQLLESRRRELRFTLPVRIEWDPQLERPGLSLQAEVADRNALATLEAELAANRKLLQDLLGVL